MILGLVFLPPITARTTALFACINVCHCQTSTAWSNLDSVVKPRQRAKMAFPHFGSLIDGRRIHDPGVSTM
jgi:hypothetical protein